MISLFFKKKNHIVIKLLFLPVLFLFIGCAQESSETKSQTLKVSLILAENSDWYKGMAKWKELVEERTNGKIKITIFPSASLSNNNQRTELEMVQSGALDASLESTITLSTLDPKFTSLSLPWIFKDYEHAFEVTDGKVGQELLEILPSKNMVGLAYGVNGFRQITNNKKEIRTPSDMKGLKIRVPLIKMYIDFYKLLGSDPSSMNFGELMTALSTGVMDGQENPVSVILAAKLYEVQKYMTIWNYSYDPIILCMNQNTFQKFSPDEQKILKDSAKEAFDYQRQIHLDEEKKGIEELKSRGMKITQLTEGEISQFKKQSQPIYQQYGEIMGTELINIR